MEAWLQQHLLKLYAAVRSGLFAASWPSVSPDMSPQQQQQLLLQLQQQLQQQQLLLLLDKRPRLVSLTPAGRAICAANMALFCL